MAMILVFTAVASLLVESGLGSALVQRQQAGSNDETSVLIVCVGIGVALAVLLASLASAIARFYEQPVLTPLIRALSLLLPLGALAVVPNALLSRRLDFRRRAEAEVAASIGAGLLALCLAWHGAGIWSLAWQAIVGALLRAVSLWVLSGWRPRGQFEFDAFARLFRFGGPLLLANLLGLVSLRLQSLLIGRLFDAQTLGVYAVAQDTQQAPAQFMSGLLNRVGLPVFATLAGEPTKLAETLRQALRLSMFVFAPCMVGIAVAAEPLVKMLYGPQWDDVAPLLSPLALAAAFWPLHVLNLAALGAIGRSDLVLRLEYAKGLVSIPLVVMAAPLGPLAVSWAVFAASIAGVCINTRYSGRLLSCGLRVQVKDLFPGLLLMVAAAGVAWLALGKLGQSLSDLGVAAAVAAVTYLVAAMLLRVQAWRDLLGFRCALQASTPPATRGTSS